MSGRHFEGIITTGTVQLPPTVERAEADYPSPACAGYRRQTPAAVDFIIKEIDDKAAYSPREEIQHAARGRIRCPSPGSIWR